jgi:hypothetical protein
VIDTNELARAPAAVAGGLFTAVRIVGDVRTEFAQILSLLQAGMNEAEAAVALDCPARLRALDLARVACDVLATNGERLAELEVRLMARSRYS